jgi:hypothetical protein
MLTRVIILKIPTPKRPLTSPNTPTIGDIWGGRIDERQVTA